MCGYVPIYTPKMGSILGVLQMAPRIRDPGSSRWGEMYWVWDDSTDGPGSHGSSGAKWFQITGEDDTDPGNLDLEAKCVGFGVITA